MKPLMRIGVAAMLCLAMTMVSAIAFAAPAQAASGSYASAAASAGIGAGANARPNVTINMMFMSSATYGYDTQMNICGVYRTTNKADVKTSKMPLVSGTINMRGKWTKSWTDENLEYGTTYYYWVQGFRLNGEATESQVMTIKTPPSNVTGAKASLSGKNTIKLTWNKASGADGYYIYQANGSDDPTKTGSETFSYTNWPNEPTYVIEDGASTSYSFPKLAADTPYFYKVTAFSKEGSSVSTSMPSDPVKMFTAPAKTKVSVALKTSSDITKPYTKTTQKVRISWNKTIKDWYFTGGEKAGYIVQRSTNNKKWTRIATVGNKTSYYDDSSVKRAKKYYYRVIPFITNADGVTTKAAVSAVKSIKTIPATGNVSKYKKLSDTKYRVTWKKASGASGYMLWCYRTGGKWTKLKEVKASQIHIDVSGLVPGAQYHVAVVPFVKNGSDKSYGTANKSWGLDRRNGKNKAFITRLG